MGPQVGNAHIYTCTHQLQGLITPVILTVSFVVTLHLEYFASSCGRVQTDHGKSHISERERKRWGRSRECRVALLYTRLLAGQTRPIFNSVIVKEVCACESPEEYAPKRRVQWTRAADKEVQRTATELI